MTVGEPWMAIGHQAAAEAAGRAVCVALGEDPDIMVYVGEPYRVRGGYAAVDRVPAPNWSRYVVAGEAAAKAWRDAE